MYISCIYLGHLSHLNFVFHESGPVDNIVSVHPEHFVTDIRLAPARECGNIASQCVGVRLCDFLPAHLPK